MTDLAERPVAARPTRRFTAPLTVATVVATVLVATTLIGRAYVAAPSAAPPVALGWPSRGALASDAAAVREAVRAWDAGVGYLVGAPDPAQPPAPPKSHSDVHVLYADEVPGGRAIVVEGKAQNGGAELGLFFSATSGPPDRRFTHQRVLPAPPRASTHHVAFFVLTRTGRALLVVVGEPGTTAISYVNAAGVAVPMAVRDGVAVAPADPTVERIVVANAGGTLYDGPVTDTVVAPDAVL